jgi:hypothetical protein
LCWFVLAVEGSLGSVLRPTHRKGAMDGAPELYLPADNTGDNVWVPHPCSLIAWVGRTMSPERFYFPSNASEALLMQ